jgi:hypothetical protein
MGADVPAEIDLRVQAGQSFGAAAQCCALFAYRAQALNSRPI